MKLLVTGRSGQLARSLAEHAVEHPNIELLSIGRPAIDLSERDELKVVADQRGNPTSALNLADALLRVAGAWQGGRTGQGQTYHLAGSGEASWYELAEQVMDSRKRLGLRAARLLPITAKDWPMRAVRPRYSVLDNSKFEQAFGFQLPNWRQSVDDVVRRLAAGR